MVPSLAPAWAQGLPPERLMPDLERLAARLSTVLSDSDARQAVVERLQASKDRVASLSSLLAEPARRERGGESAPFVELLAQVQDLEREMTAAGLAVPRLDIMLPVRAHRELLANSDTILIAVPPLGEEGEAASVTAYDNGQPVALDAAEPPAIPTLVILPAERESLDPTYPLMTAAKPGVEENPRTVDDFVGIAQIEIDDDHESWVCGDPEIYVITGRFNYPLGLWIYTRQDLPGVNLENVLYSLGDPNGTYEYVDAVNWYSRVTFAIWEDDNTFCGGGDDSLGSVSVGGLPGVIWQNLPFGGYTSFGTADADVEVDRD